jgi:hypothetical protein
MALLTAQIVDGSLEEAALASAAAGGDYFQAAERVPYWRYYLRLKNTDGSPVTATIASQRADDQGNTVNTSVVVPATSGDMLVPLGDHHFDDARKCFLTYSAVTALTVGVLQLHATPSY